jgi:hypothetical protein
MKLFPSKVGWSRRRVEHLTDGVCACEARPHRSCLTTARALYRGAYRQTPSLRYNDMWEREVAIWLLNENVNR